MSLKSTATTIALSTMATFSAYGQNKHMVSPELMPSEGHHMSVTTDAKNGIEATYTKDQKILKLHGIDRDGNGILSPDEIDDVTLIAPVTSSLTHIALATASKDQSGFVTKTAQHLKSETPDQPGKFLKEHSAFHDNFKSFAEQDIAIPVILPHYLPKISNPK